MDYALSFALGVCASLLATYIAYRVVQFRRRGLARKLEGYWIEHVLGSERPVSICRLRYHKRSASYVYSGRNFYPSGEDYCDFESESVVFDWKAQRMFYIYRFWKTGEIGRHTYGFGWITITEEADAPSLADGHYRSSDSESVARHTRLIPIESAASLVQMEAPGGLQDAEIPRLVSKLAAKLTNDG